MKKKPSSLDALIPAEPVDPLTPLGAPEGSCEAPGAGGENPPAPENGEARPLKEVVALLLARTGHDFSLHKKHTFHRRVERRMGLQKIGDIGAYVRFLQENPQEIELLLKDLLIGVTSFFRDPMVWDELGQDILPRLMAGREDGGVLRAWIPGCSTGEEAYTLAMVFKESLERSLPQGSLSLQIFATDLDKDAIEKARIGLYPLSIAPDVTQERLDRFFMRDEQGYRVSKEIRETLVFAPHNVAKDPPFTRMDLLLCRNMLIYFDQELQKRLLPLFHYSLNPGGVLFLGNAETVGTFTDLFAKLPGRGRFYRARAGVSGTARNQLLATTPRARGTSAAAEASKPLAPNLQSLADRLVLERFAPPAVLTNASGDIVSISGRPGRFLEPVSGRAAGNIFAMVRPGLRFELGEAYQRALRSRAPVTLRGAVLEEEGERVAVDVLVQPLSSPEALSGMVITVFRKASGQAGQSLGGHATLAGDHGRLAGLRGKARTQNEELSGAGEQMMASQEGNRAANEELQLANEELRTVNNELQVKLDELSQAYNDLKNLLNSTDIATLFLDRELNVRHFTKRVTSIINLVPSDVGRPVTGITSSLDYPDLAADAQEVLNSLILSEKAVNTHDGLCYLVRIMPYRTVDNRIAGVVITFTGISATKKLEAAIARDAKRHACEAFPSGEARDRFYILCDPAAKAPGQAREVLHE